MKRITRAIAVAAVLWSSIAPASAMVTLKADKLTLDMYGRAQMIGVGQNLSDPYRDKNRLYLFMKQSRIGFKGMYEDVKFDTQFAFGGENANGSNTDLGLLDFVVDIPFKPLGDGGWIKIGQFRVPYSREGLTDRGLLNFGDRSVANLGSYQSRDYGIAVMDTRDAWTWTFGTFSSGGRDVPQRYLPERLGIPYMVARFGYNDGVDEDIYHVAGSDINLSRTTKAAFLNAVFVEDTLIGHSSALQSRTIDKNLLVDTGFNPYINQGGGTGLGTIAGTDSMNRGDAYWVGGDAVIRHPLGEGKAIFGEIEGNYGGYDNRRGNLHIANARVAGGYRVNSVEIGARYALLFMDKKSAFLSNSLTTTGTTAGTTVRKIVSNQFDRPVQEITPSITRYFKGHNMKLVMDTPVYLNCPLWVDKMGNVTPLGSQPLGAYAFPDPTSTTQNSLLATPGNYVTHKTVVEARMMFQFMF